MSRVIRGPLAASVMAAVIGATYTAGAAEQRITAGADEIIVTYPTGENEHVRALLTYRNSAEQTSKGGHHVVETDYGPVVVHIAVGVAETLTVVEWPQELWPYPMQIDVDDGDEGEIAFIAPMM